MDLIIRLIIWIVRSIASEASAAKTRRELASEGIDPTAIPVDGGMSAGAIKSQLQADVGHLLEQLDTALRRGDAAHGLALGLERDLGHVAGGRVLTQIVVEQARPSLDTGLAVLRRARKRAEELNLVEILRQIPSDPEVREAFGEVMHAANQIDVLAVLRDTRSHPEDGLRLADADAIAASLLKPIQDFTAAHPNGLPVERPIAAPAMRGGEAIWMGLLPERYPVLFVPANFLEDLYRYASVPHELGHLLWRDLPGLAVQVQEAMGFQPHEGMFYQRNGQVIGSLDQLYTAWLPEIFADMVAALQLGPAALRGFVHSFAAEGSADEVTRVFVADRAYDEHPPAHVRIHLAAHMLWTMGYDQEAKAILAEWDALHGEPQTLSVPLATGGILEIKAEAVIQPGREAVERLYMAQLAALAGLRLVDVPGMEMSPGLWARVKRRSAQLIADKPFNDEGRIVLAAAILARTERPALAVTITAGLRRAILGLDADERAVEDSNYQPLRSLSHRSWLNEVRSSMILRELLHGRGGMAARRRAGRR